jgi:hypothetical protein
VVSRLWRIQLFNEKANKAIVTSETDTTNTVCSFRTYLDFDCYPVVTKIQNSGRRIFDFFSFLVVRQYEKAKGESSFVWWSLLGILELSKGR